MSGGAIMMMVIGMVLIWGGLATSIIHAVKKDREKQAAK